jgi:hypothetical protein
VSPTLHFLAGLALPVPAWLMLRRAAGARASAWMLLDAAPVVALPLAILALTARPLLAGGIAAAIGLTLLVADRAKRAALGEPLVFTDAGLLWQVVAHPRFYLPFVPRGLMLGGLAAGVLAIAAVLVFEPALPLGTGGRLALVAAALVLAAPLLRPLAFLRGAPPARDPVADAARFGPLATFALHARIAAVERPARRAAHPPAPAVLLAGRVAPHLVLLQLESFCDPARLGLGPPLPGWQALAEGALQRGALSVPGFGANTMRTEFAVLTGLAEEELGLDRLNPYFRFARAPVGSLAWALRGAGYRTACLHPFDPRFFARNRVLPNLGFERFVAEADFAGAAREHGLVADAALGARIAEELRAAEAPAFLFAITVAAHGPWPGPDPVAAWAARMAATDRMIAKLAEVSRRLARPVVIAAFGDHRPAQPQAQGGRDTEYMLWRSDVRGEGRRRDLDAAGLHRVIRAAVLG